MEKIIITATAESLEQVDALLALGVDRIYVGDKAYGLRLPHTFSPGELRLIAEKIHQAGKEMTVAVNALMHQGMMDALPDYLDFLQEIRTDYITVGDAGVFQVIKRDKRPLKTIYDASTMVTSSRQINFWGKQAGASEAVLAREIPSKELFELAEQVQIPVELLVYGASVIHHSKRPLIENYYHFTHIDDEKSRERDLFLAEPQKSETHYSIYEDNHGTHIFANNDLDMMPNLIEVVQHGLTHWKLDGIYTPGQDFVAIVAQFVKARDLIEAGQFSQDQAFVLDEIIHKHHPANRSLDTGFYDFDPETVK